MLSFLLCQGFLLLGKNGQVGWELQRSLSILGELIAVDFYDKDLCGDLTDTYGIAETIRTVQPDVVVNAADHTAVDKAESEKELARILFLEHYAFPLLKRGFRHWTKQKTLPVLFKGVKIP